MTRNDSKQRHDFRWGPALALSLLATVLSGVLSAACGAPEQPPPSDLAPPPVSLLLSVDGLSSEVSALELQAHLQPVTSADQDVFSMPVPIEELALGLYSLTLPPGRKGVLTVLISSLDPSGCRTGSGRRDVWIDSASSREVSISLIRSSVRSCPLTVLRGGNGGGRVRSEPPGIECGPTCSGYFDDGSLVALTAMPDATSVFAGALSCESLKGAVCSVRMQGRTAVNVLFDANTLSISKIGTGMGQVVSDPPGISCGTTCQMTVPTGTAVTLTATAAPGSIFISWTGACTGTARECQLTLNTAATATANFAVCATDFCPLESGTTSNLAGVWGSAASDVWAVGDSGKILHWDGSRWSATESRTSSFLLGVWGSAASDVWTVGGGGTILHWDGSRWSASDSGTTNTLAGIWGSAANDVWAVGYLGTALHWDGSKWSSRNSGTSSFLSGVWGSAADDVWAVSQTGTALHWDGSSFSAKSSGSSRTLFAVWGSAANDVWAVGYDGIVHWDGSSFSAKDSGTYNGLAGVWGSAASDVWAVGGAGTIRHWDGSSFSAKTATPALGSLRSVFSQGSQVWIVGGSGLILYRK